MIISGKLKIFIICLFIIFHRTTFAQTEWNDQKNSKINAISNHDRERLGILTNMEKVMGKLPRHDKHLSFNLQITDSVIEENFTRYNLTFNVTDKERLPVYLYIPKQIGIPKKLPAMLVLHGTHALGKGVVDGQGEKPNRAHARELAQRGYVVIAPDYPSFGDLKDHDFETDRYKSATMQAIVNHMRCIDLLQSRADVDPAKIGVIGHSLGGHNSMFVSAFDERIKVTVSSCGWTQFEYYNIGEEGSKKYGGRLGPWAQTRYMPLIRSKYDLDARKIPFNFSDIIAAIAPRAFFSVSPLRDTNFDYKGVENGILKVKPVFDSLGMPNNLQVRYPNAEHDFPVENRIEAYAFIDKVFNFKPLTIKLK